VGEGVEEVPEGGAVGDGVIDGAADEEAVSEFGDLNGENRGVMAGVADFPVEGEELLEAFGDVERGQEVADAEGGGIGVYEIDAGVVASDVNVTVGIGG